MFLHIRAHIPEEQTASGRAPGLGGRASAESGVSGTVKITPDREGQQSVDFSFSPHFLFQKLGRSFKIQQSFRKFMQGQIT